MWPSRTCWSRVIFGASAVFLLGTNAIETGGGCCDGTARLAAHPPSLTVATPVLADSFLHSERTVALSPRTPLSHLGAGNRYHSVASPRGRRSHVVWEQTEGRMRGKRADRPEIAAIQGEH